MADSLQKSMFEHEKTGFDADSIKQSLANCLTYSVGKDTITATDRDRFFAAAYLVRNRLIDRWMETMRGYYINDVKRVYYFSLEFLMGRTLMNSVHNLGFDQQFREALNDLGINLDSVREIEPDAALGNGGLGRLAACFLDSMATLDLPGYGYGIRYEYGMFAQRIEDGRQVEHPDNWLRYGNPWEFPRPEVLYQVKFHGRAVQYPDEQGVAHYHWIDTDDVMAMAFDTPIPGYGTHTVNNMRLWSAKATRDFELRYFNEGNYVKAVEDKNDSENLSKVLYPDDTTTMGRELRLKQQYFFVCASLHDILYRYNKYQSNFDALPDKVAIQLNDTHPAIAIPELMRVLVDLHHLDWEKAWDITTRTFAYTNHTLMPEALETWTVALFENVLPRHLQIIYEINRRFLKDVMHRYPGDTGILRRMSIIDESGEKRIRMAHLAIVGSHKVNGVAQIHTELMKQTIFSDFDVFFPGKIINITNGITPRRWLNQANRRLAELITTRIGSGWVKDLSQLKRLIPLVDDASFRKEFAAVKRADKERLVAMLKQKLNIDISPDSLFDVQIKRIHEYKRQLLNVLHVVTLYNRIRHNPNAEYVSRTVIFGGKAAPGYVKAKLIIKLINDIADIVNNDPQVSSYLKVVFMPNYDVSAAEEMIPAADLSEQISTAGTEASGTGNMKLALNGALTIGTLDGANIEISGEVGENNIFIFGLTAAEVAETKANGYQPWDFYHANPELRAVLDMIGSGFFSPDEPDRFKPIVDTLLEHGDQYLLLADYASYIDCQKKVEVAYRDQEQWVRKAILNVANMSKFSSDRTIMQYASEIWDAKPVASRSVESGGIG
ncbi:glycogen phosphorylase [Nitrosospira sp. Nsp5]|uniref:Alpha-1,4 glucan phosphorylase n=2 Tax=Nitrosomonadaceae TaxID=206379 RepID=A0ABY0TJ72_9PROT|nr:MULTISPECIES: glycogen/starch/alpha-glucan phosphorylase [Nitrosospira]PTR05952.1 glycogen phosphorylase [Nitrosospira sp. Nsp5]SDQ92332.1 glycogen phosphorylase [Nitrosospira multiformis]